jgi:hypothetical protein
MEVPKTKEAGKEVKMKIVAIKKMLLLLLLCFNSLSQFLRSHKIP